MKQFLAFAGGALVYGASKTVASPGVATSLDDLAEGAIGIFANDGTTGKLILVDSAADFADVKSFVVARGLAKGAMISDSIERSSLGVRKVDPVTAVMKAVTVSNIPADLPAFSVVEVVISNTEALITTDWRVKRASYMTKTANEAPASIAGKLAASLNKKDIPAVASVSGNNLLLIAKDDTKDFAVNVDGALEGRATVAVTTQPVRAEGDYLSLKDLQLECEGYQGRTNYYDRTTGPTAESDLIMSTSGTHVQYNIDWNGTTRRLAVATDPVAQRFKRLYLAIPSGAAAIATLESILGFAALEEVAAQAEEVGK